MLDPWFFPLTDEVFSQNIMCPVLILANEYFVYVKDANTRNRNFMKNNPNAVYICWKKGDHLHQTDQCFISGNSFNVIKNIDNAWKIVENNLQAISMFLETNDITPEKRK